MHPAAADPETLWRQCDVRRLRRSGPGGQHRNKVETAIALEHTPTGVTAEAGERRSQAENRAAALFRLRVNLALEVRGGATPAGAGDQRLAPPSDLWRRRCGGGRIAVSSRHDDFPALLAEALDAVAACRADVRGAAERLGCTPSQLIKFLKQEPRAMALVNRWRADEGFGALK